MKKNVILSREVKKQSKKLFIDLLIFAIKYLSGFSCVFSFYNILKLFCFLNGQESYPSFIQRHQCPIYNGTI